MAKYSIEDTTLTALGDAIRGKVGETKEEAVLTKDLYSFHFNSKEVDRSEFIVADGGNKYQYVYKFPIEMDVSKYKLIYTAFLNDSGNESIIVYARTPGVNRSTYLTPGYVDREGELKAYAVYPSLVEVNINIWKENLDNPDAIPTTLDLLVIPLDSNGDEIESIKMDVPNTFTPIGMAEAINNMPETPPESAFNISGNCSYRFSWNGWNWFIEKYGDRVKTEGITQCTNMFNSSDKLEEIPFIINTGNNTSFSNIFNYCEKLKTAPVINKPEGVVTTGSSLTLSSFFENCYSLGTLPNDYFNNFITAEDWEKFKTASNQMSRLFSGCRVLREVPDMSNFSGKYASYSYSSSLYYYGFQNCYSLNKVTNLPVKDFDFSAFTSNAFGNCFSRCARLNRVTFQTNEDGTPVVTTWKNQSIDLTSEVGYTTNYYSYFKNAGITDDKEVKDDTTYQALKNDEDWWTKKDAYCRYNKTSALETISTLPDVSAGSGNTIKFRGVAGSATDGGAINTMTEEEIAVAAVKGWTVSFV